LCVPNGAGMLSIRIVWLASETVLPVIVKRESRFLHSPATRGL
jgi:hypothetical protein